jgi:hypothetical protein
MRERGQLKESIFLNGIQEHSFSGMGGFQGRSRLFESNRKIVGSVGTTENFHLFILNTGSGQSTGPQPLPLPLSIQLFERRVDGTCHNPARLLVGTLGRDWWEGEQMWAAVAVF